MRSPTSCCTPSASATPAWLEANPTRVKVGGRMMVKRVMGKASFAKLADRTGQIQLFLQRSTLGEVYDEFKGWDVGDIARRRRRAVQTQDRRAVGAASRSCALLVEVAAAAAGQVARPRRHGDPLSPALRRSHHRPSRVAQVFRTRTRDRAATCATSSTRWTSSKSRRR